jgi:cytochrome P450
LTTCTSPTTIPIFSPAPADPRQERYPEIPILVTNDPPEHSRVRKLVNRSFSAPAVAALEPSMVQLVTT